MKPKAKTIELYGDEYIHIYNMSVMLLNYLLHHCRLGRLAICGVDLSLENQMREGPTRELDQNFGFKPINHIINASQHTHCLSLHTLSLSCHTVKCKNTNKANNPENYLVSEGKPCTNFLYL